MLDYNEILQQIDCENYSRTVVVKCYCPFGMTIAKRVPLTTWSCVVHFEDTFLIAIFPKRTRAEIWQPLIEACKEFTADFELL